VINSLSENNLEFSSGYNEWKTKVSPPFLRRGGSAHSFVIWTYSYAETGWLKRNADGIATTSPKSMRIEGFPGYQTGSHGFGYSSCPGGEFSVHQNYLVT